MWFPVFARSSDLSALRERVNAIEKAEAVRSAEWLDTLDRFERLYKRLSMREARSRGSSVGSAADDTPHASEAAESPLSMRRRLRGV